jgi:hypothetical protein
MTRMRLDNLSTSTTLESNKSLSRYTLFINGIATPPMAKYSGVHSRSYCVIIDIIANNFLRLPAVNSKIVQSTGDLHHKIVILFFRIAENIFDNATSFDPRNDMLNHNSDT